MCAATTDEADAPRVALVGATSLLGKEIKQRLADAGYPGAALSLLDFEEVAGVITDYGDEARVLAEAVAEEILAHDVACFCGSPEAAEEHLERLRLEGRVGIDCTGAWCDRDDVFLWLPGVSRPPRLADSPAVALPSAAAMLLGTVIDGLGEAADRAAVTLLVPASEWGEEGLHELSQQTIAVLNLEEIDQEVFGRQLAFDVFPAAGQHDAATGRVAAELQRLGLPTPALNVVSASVFHGLAASVFVPGIDASAVAAVLGNAGVNLEDAGADAVDSPVRAAGRAGLHATVRPDRADGSWIWVVGDNLVIRAHAAVAAVLSLVGPEQAVVEA
jgi:aspartate-semialdehyde dehydrogenase